MSRPAKPRAIDLDSDKSRPDAQNTHGLPNFILCVNYMPRKNHDNEEDVDNHEEVRSVGEMNNVKVGQIRDWGVGISINWLKSWR